MLARIAVAVVAVTLVSGCSGTDQLAVPDPNGKTVICGRALAATAALEVGDDLKRKSEQAKDAAVVLHDLATKTQDQSLATALDAAADKAAEAAKRNLTAENLSKWATETVDRITALRKACF